MSRPVRIQLSRKKGFNLQEHSRSINGLPAKAVARPSLWSNRFRIGEYGNRHQCVHAFRMQMKEYADVVREQLAGFNLACWCRPGDECHADVLLEIANAALPPPPEEK